MSWLSEQFAQDDRERRTQAIRRMLAVILLLNLLVALAKISYGTLTNSLSMTADGLHSLLDGVSNIVGLIGIAVAARPPDPNHPYGHRRFETLTSLGIALFMLIAFQQILQGAWARWQSGDTPDVTGASFAVMLVTLTINIGVTLWERRAGRRYNSSILIADARHTLSDVLVSLSVIGGLILVQAGYPAADLALALVVAGAIAWGAWSIIREAALTLSDATVVPAMEIDQAARSVRGVRGVHNIRTRGGDGMIWVDLHIQVDPALRVDRAHDIASDVAAQVEGTIGEPSDVTVHVEPADPDHLKPERGYQPGG